MANSRITPASSLIYHEQGQWNHKYQELKQSILLPNKASAFLDCLAHMADPSFGCSFEKNNQNQSHKCPNNHFEHRYFCKGFSQLSKSEKQNFVIKLMETTKTFIEEQNQDSKLAKKAIKYECQMKDPDCFLPQWNKATVVVNFQLKKLSLQNQSAGHDLLLSQYIPRISKVHQSQIIFEFIGPVTLDKQQIRLACCKQQQVRFNELYKQLMALTIECQAKRLARMMNKYKANILKTSKKRQVHVFITPKIINQCCKRKNQGGQKIISQLELQSANLLPDLPANGGFTTVKSTSKMTISYLESHPYIYRASYFTFQNPQCMKIRNFLQQYYNTHRMIFKTKELERCVRAEDPMCQIVVFYQKIIINERIFSQIILMHQNISIQGGENNLTLYFKNIDHPQNLSFIQKMEIKSKQIRNVQHQITIDVEFSQQRGFDSQAYVSYFENFKQTFGLGQAVNTVRQTREERQSRKSLINLYKNESTQAPSYLAEEFEKLSCRQPQINMHLQSRQLRSMGATRNNSSESPQQISLSEQFNCLKHRYKLDPSVEKTGKLMSDHFLWKFWRRCEDGGLVCKDEELVERQKQMAKVVLAKFGQNILRGKNIINFSLPVVVFKKESHLESLAKTFLYSPVFIQRSVLAKDPLERMKNAIVMMMTENALSIHMQKPFNPILGQTYQGYIDGCPIYLEQISHHPPVSAYFFSGRGYKKYGSIEPQISVGLNRGSGFSLNPHYIEYEDGMKIQYICAKIVIGGILVGERTFKFQDKIYAYDRQNRFFASMKFGPVKEGLFNKSPQPQDYFHGNIYKVSEQFEKRFYSTSPRPHPEKKQIVSKLASFDGIWNSYVRVNNEEVVNFMTDLPYHFEYENCPLPSDCRFREDRRQLVKGDLEKAQQAKQKLQDEQRHDRKLRQKFQQKQHNYSNDL